MGDMVKVSFEIDEDVIRGEYDKDWTVEKIVRDILDDVVFETLQASGLSIDEFIKNLKVEVIKDGERKKS